MLSPGKVLEIDLTTRQCTQQPYPECWAVTYLAGRGFNAAWLYAHLSADTDALGPENPLMFSCGLLTDKTAPSASRVHINALSPLTGLLGSSNVSGNFGMRLRGCGIQSIIVRGRADAPVYLFIDINNLCSLLGMDIISTANAVAFAMDLFARGILTTADFEGIELTWGDAAAVQVLVHQIAEVRGLGSILSLGVRRAAEIIGNGANRYAPHIKGLELPAYHPAHLSGMCLGYAVSSRGGDFSNIYASMEYTWSGKRAAAAFGTKEAVRLDGTYGKAGLIRRAMLVNAAIDSLGICKVQALSLIGDFDMLNEAQLCSALTAFEFQALDLMRIGERIITRPDHFLFMTSL
jgi:aldehyde:ferredoxin oxidoreductase